MKKQNDNLVKQMKEEIEFLKGEKDIRKLENDRIKLELELADHEKEADVLEEKYYGPHPLFNKKNIRFFILFLILFIVAFPFFKSLIYYAINTVESKSRDANRVEILNRIGLQYSEFYVMYSTYPSLFIDDTVVKVYTDTVRDANAHVLEQNKILDKFDVSEYGFDLVVLGRSGCQKEIDEATADLLWLCSDPKTHEVGTAMENSDQVMYLIEL